MKRILITGASRGIGRAIAMKLASSDVTLLLHGRDTVALAETCRALEKSGAKTAKLIHDLAKFRAADAARLQHRQYFVHRSKDRLSKLERILREQVCPGRIIHCHS